MIVDIVESLDNIDVSSLKEIFTSQSSLPPEFDGRLLTTGRSSIGRDLTAIEKRETRRRFRTTILLRS